MQKDNYRNHIIKKNRVITFRKMMTILKS